MYNNSLIITNKIISDDPKDRFKIWSKGHPLFGLTDKHEATNECQVHSSIEGIDEPQYENYNYQTFSKGYPREPLRDSDHPYYPLLGSNYEDGKLFFSSTLKRTYRSYSFRGYCTCPKKLERGDSECPQCYGNKSYSIGGEVIYPCNNALMNFISLDLIKYEMGLNKLIHFGSPSNARVYFIQLNEEITSSIPEKFTNSNLLAFWENFVKHIDYANDPGLHVKLAKRNYDYERKWLPDTTFYSWDVKSGPFVEGLNPKETAKFRFGEDCELNPPQRD